MSSDIQVTDSCWYLSPVPKCHPFTLGKTWLRKSQPTQAPGSLPCPLALGSSSWGRARAPERCFAWPLKRSCTSIFESTDGRLNVRPKTMKPREGNTTASSLTPALAMISLDLTPRNKSDRSKNKQGGRPQTESFCTAEATVGETKGHLQHGRASLHTVYLVSG